MADWKTLAAKQSQKFGFPNNVDIVLATVEAETNGQNIMGDNERAFGYGQVWLKWHFNELQEVAKAMNINLPTNTVPTEKQEKELYQNLILNNNNLSMGLATKTIKKAWNSCHSNWDEFTNLYVGPNIPSHDRERRRSIWKKYQGMTASNYLQ